MKKLLFLSLLAFSLRAQTVTTVVTLGWTYSFGSEVPCSSTVMTLCDLGWVYGTLSGSTLTPLGSVGLPPFFFPSYTVTGIVSSGSDTFFALSPSSPSPDLYPALGGYDLFLVVSGASGTGCSVLNGTFPIIGGSSTGTGFGVSVTLSSSGCSAYTASSATAQIGYTVSFQSTLSGSQTFGVAMAGLDGGGNYSEGTASPVTVTLPTPTTPSPFSSGSPSNVSASHVP